MGQSAFGKYAWLVLAYCLPVIAFGAFVRATHSGDGCGNHWPTCGGEIIPIAPSVERVIEFTHRVSSGLIGIFVVILAVWAFRAFPRKDPVRKLATATLVFTFLEAFIGAVLVKKGYVDQNESVGRALVMSLHLLNTFLLLASITALVWLANKKSLPQFRGQGGVGWALGLTLVGSLVLGVSGAVTALGDTITNGASAAEAAKLNLAPMTQLLVQLRLLHPIIAISIGVLMMLALGFVVQQRPGGSVKKHARWAIGLFLVQMVIGLINVSLQAPVPMQLVHLVFADLIWIALIFVSLAACSQGLAVNIENDAIAEPKPARTFSSVVQSYIVLTKPRVISLLLFTTLAAMFIAARGWPGGWLLLFVAIGGYCSAGAANTINMVIDRDIDGQMKRTSKRPTVTAEISTGSALAFGLTLALVGFGLLWWSANLLAALMAMAGLAFYVVVYTILLKRRTWYNIVIGGAAGSFPPLVGYAAVTGNLSPLAWILFGIIFLWTPVHFWALALMIKDDYASAGIPMLPVVKGERATVIQIAFYAVLTAIICILPVLQPVGLGLPYLVVAVMLNALLIARSVSLMKNTDRPHAVSLYKYSMLYLALLFLTIAIDRAISF